MKMAVFWVVAPRRALMMEAVQTSETSVNSYQSTGRYDPEDSHPRFRGYPQSFQLNASTLGGGGAEKLKAPKYIRVLRKFKVPGDYLVRLYSTDDYVSTAATQQVSGN
jgi:hypothetical protein